MGDVGHGYVMNRLEHHQTARVAHARAGSTLVETMLAALLLSVMALGAGAYMTQSRARTYAQRTHQLAAETAVDRLESLWASDYTNLTPAVQDYAVRFLAPANVDGAWTVSDFDPGETVALAGRAYPIATEVQFIDADSGTVLDNGEASYNALRLTVRVGYRGGGAERVVMETVRTQ